MSMEKIVTALVAVVLSAGLLICGCTESDGGSDDTGQSIVGTWQLTGATIAGVNADLSTIGLALMAAGLTDTLIGTISGTVTFAANGTFTASGTAGGENDSTQGTYTDDTASRRVTITVEGQNLDASYAINGTTLTLSGTYEGVPVSLTLTRI